MKLQLSWPLKEITVTQYFGQNATSFYKDNNMTGHSGIDFRAADGTPVYSSHDGRVTYAGYDGAGGLTIVIRTEEAYDYKDGQSFFKTVYGHLKKGSLIVTAGQSVKRGDQIAEADNTGQSTGSHLHFGFKPIYRGEQDWQWYNLEQDNGTYGAIDPEPYMPNIREFRKIMKRGDQNEDVRKMQSFFVSKGIMQPIYKGWGVYGPATQAAVKQFQIDNGIPHNEGKQVGPLTLKALNKKYE